MVVQDFLSFSHYILFLLPKLIDLTLVHLDLLEIEALLHGLLVLFSLVIAIKHLNLVFEFIQFLLDLGQNLAELVLLGRCILDGFTHASDLDIELGSACHLLEHFQEALLALVHQVLHLALLNYLELGAAAQRKVGALQQIRQVLGGDWLPIDVVILAVGIAIVRFLDGDLCCVVGDSVLGVVEGDLNPVGAGASA
jgi:hypothetical protein